MEGKAEAKGKGMLAIWPMLYGLAGSSSFSFQLRLCLVVACLCFPLIVLKGFQFILSTSCHWLSVCSCLFYGLSTT